MMDQTKAKLDQTLLLTGPNTGGNPLFRQNHYLISIVAAEAKWRSLTTKIIIRNF